MKTEQLIYYELTNWEIIAPEMTADELQACETKLNQATHALSKTINALAELSIYGHCID